MSEMVEIVFDKVKDVILYIPRKIVMHFDNYSYLEDKYAEYNGYKKEVEKRLNCIKLTTEQNHYGNEESYKRKIIELATYPIEANSK